MTEIQLRRFNRQFNEKVMSRLLARLTRIASTQIVYIDFEEVDGMTRGALQQLVMVVAAIGDSRIRIIGVSEALWIEFEDLWLMLGGIVVRPH